MLTEEQPVYKIIRLRILEGKPFILEHTYMPVHLVPNLKRSHLETSIYQYVKRRTRHSICRCLSDDFCG